MLPVPKKNLASYKRMSQRAGRVWRDHGAMEYWEYVGEDLKMKMGVPFTTLVKAKPGETVIFSWIMYRSRAHRDAVNARVMKDPRIAKMTEGKTMPFDVARMAWGGFAGLVEA